MTKKKIEKDIEELEPKADDAELVTEVHAEPDGDEDASGNEPHGPEAEKLEEDEVKDPMKGVECVQDVRKAIDDLFNLLHEEEEPKDEESKEEESEDESEEEKKEEPKGEESKEKTEVKFDESEEEAKVLKTADDEKAEECVDSLVKAESLDPAAKTRIRAVLKNAVNEAVARRVALIKDKAAQFVAEGIENNKVELAEQLDEYASFVANEYVTENKVAIQHSIKLDLMESFAEGLRDLFLEHNIMVPEGKEDLVEKLSSTLDTVNEQLSKQVEVSKKLQEEVVRMSKSEVLNTLCEGLTLPQSERLRSLAEEVEFTNKDAFNRKMSVIKEKYLTAPVTEAKVVEEAKEPTKTTSSLIDRYVAAKSAR